MDQHASGRFRTDGRSSRMNLHPQGTPLPRSEGLQTAGARPQIAVEQNTPRVRLPHADKPIARSPGARAMHTGARHHRASDGARTNNPQALRPLQSSAGGRVLLRRASRVAARAASRKWFCRDFVRDKFFYPQKPAPFAKRIPRLTFPESAASSTNLTAMADDPIPLKLAHPGGKRVKGQRQPDGIRYGNSRTYLEARLRRDAE